MTNLDIDALLRQDEAVLRTKRRRLKTFAAALADVRAANERASKLVIELLDAGDLTRSDLRNVFGLTKGERAELVPASRRTSRPDAEHEHCDAVPDQEEESGTDVDDALDEKADDEQG